MATAPNGHANGAMTADAPGKSPTGDAPGKSHPSGCSTPSGVPQRLEAAPTGDVEALLAARAERLKKRLTMKADEPTIMVAQFRVGEGQYAIPLGDFRAAVPLKLVTPVPLSPPQVVGILRYQGQVISALSLASLLGVRGWRTDPTVLLVVEPTPGKLVGLDSEEIPKPGPLPLSVVEKARQRENAPVVELFLPGAERIHYVDLAALLAREGWMANGH